MCVRTHTHTQVIHLRFPQTDSQFDRPHRISSDGRFQPEGLTGGGGGDRDDPHVRLPAGEAEEGGDWCDEG